LKKIRLPFFILFTSSLLPCNTSKNLFYLYPKNTMHEMPYIPRDVSWLAFNERVLQEAQDERVPLYERIKFLAIYSSNLEEFFRVRVASLRSFRKLKKKTRRALEIQPKKELREIRQLVQQQQQAFGRTFREEILPALRKRGIHLVNEQEWNEEQQAFAGAYFLEHIQPSLQIITLNNPEDTPFLENAVLYFVVQLQHTLAIVNIPSQQLPRFITLPASDAGHCIAFLDDIIRYNLPTVFNEYIQAAYAIKLSRDAELNLEDEFAGNLVEKIKKGLKTRNIGLPTRFLYDSTMPADLLLQLKSLFQLSKNDLIPGGRYHNFNDFLKFPNVINAPTLHDEPLPPLPHPVLENADSILKIIQAQDILLHFPYQKYDYIVRLLEEAARDASVESIKITLYRIASDSAIVMNLLKAREKGKQVTVFIEAKARFDEENNLRWGARLQAAGAVVFYIQPGIKVHSKLLLISRRESKYLHHYAYIGTGNFNEKTARLYTDHALLTADQRLNSEVLQVFNYLEHKTEFDFKHLLVSPLYLRKQFTNLIDQEIAHARAGKPAAMRLKMNSLEDKAMIAKLYEASQAGVQIQLIVRGICSLVAGVASWSENVQVISIVDRFLEHARIYWFANGGEEKLYIASADWMTRNLDRRVEVATPIYDKKLFNELKTILGIQWKDNSKARLLQTDKMNHYKTPAEEEPVVRAQMDIYRLLSTKKPYLNLPAST